MFFFLCKTTSFVVKLIIDETERIVIRRIAVCDMTVQILDRKHV